MTKNHKIKAGSLQFVLFIGAVIAVLLLTFVLLSHSHIFFAKKSNKFMEVIECNSFSVKLALQPNGKAIASNNNSYEKDGISTEVKKGLWGVFDHYTAVSSFEKINFSSSVLVGYGVDETLPALYLKDNQRPLIVAGNTKIVGNAVLPQQGIRPGTISGNSYFGNRLVHGTITQSTAILPNLESEKEKNIKYLCGPFSPKNGVVPLTPSRNSSYSNSFLQPTKYITGDYINLTSVSLTGNIIVVASREIQVDASSNLQDIILAAPTISIKNNTKGTFQAFASKRIEVGNNCILNYPSALVLHETATDQQQNQPNLAPLFVGSGSIIKGILIYQKRSEEKMFYPQIKINTNATVIGQLHCEKNVELKGEVRGSVYTDGFMALENGSIYQNHLYNGSIDFNQLQEQFVGLGWNDTAAPKKIAKWLY
ncbi:hypothetical protein MTsPCn5_16550 [Croceitalea sp. MTPC5]|uniref:hypothetical protein n=1 Tax=Croceitalea sp. MTPC5 TaxID=3056565 RepID=UPI002B3CD9B3|nr:hypothetical protein MTsPCn5_16550 [Croceitalea sp. MTPC5]